jgi:3-oxoacyl-(acyl-carrier-protein) synthase
MSVRIAGRGWVTPLGSDIGEVWQRLLCADTVPPSEISDRIGKKTYLAYRVPPDTLKNLPLHPRLRRASAISRFGAAAGLAALQEAKLALDETAAKRTALVFAIANGGVIYTKRFYTDIVKSGAGTASPLLFPETVFNAAASHLAAILGLSGATYTLVGDGAVGLVGIQMAEDIMADQDLDNCLVVAAEEADWLLCDAYQKWRLLRSNPPIQPFDKTNRGTILSEGAGAVLLSRTGSVQIDSTSAGSHYSKRSEAAQLLEQALVNVKASRASFIVASANGTFIDEAEASAIANVSAGLPAYAPKAAFGDGVAASSLWQLIVATQILFTGKTPRPQLNLKESRGSDIPAIDLPDCCEVVVLSCGMNQQVGATCLSMPTKR